ncbi:MAG TPA: acyl-CoA desaturase [Bacteroidia bacterium]|nr:acyl-CoA desaturase [Bacteroidia bacterium]
MNVSFKSQGNAFFQALRSGVNAYFKTNGIRSTGNFQLYLKTVIIFLALAALYTWVVFFTPGVWLSVAICSFLGLCAALIGFNVMHDGSHGSYSRNKTVNRIMAYSLNLLGGNAFFWTQKHNQNHHTYTNVEGLDDDIDLKPFLRVHHDQPKKKIHRYQHIYFFVLYGVTYLFWVYYRDFLKYFTGKIAENTKLSKMSLREHIVFWVSKLVHIGVFLVIPMLFAGVRETIIGYLIMAFVMGFTLAIVFQLAHLVEGAEFTAPEPGKDTNIETEWAIYQVNTTVNFATRNRVLSWLLGGLNYQMEHHLFPKISHVHYPAVHRIVKQVCTEYNVSYIEHPTMISAIRSHIRHLRALGKAD